MYSVFHLKSLIFMNQGSENVFPKWLEVHNCFFSGSAPSKSSQGDLEFSIETANIFLLGSKLQIFLVFVLFCSGYYKRLPQTEWHISKRNLFLFSQFWKLRSPRSRHWQIRCLKRTRFIRFTYSCLLAVSSQVEGVSELCGVSFIWTLIPLMRALLSWPNHLPKPHLLIPSYWGWASTNRFWRTQCSYTPQKCFKILQSLR